MVDVNNDITAPVLTKTETIIVGAPIAIKRKKSYATHRLVKLERGTLHLKTTKKR